MKQQVKHKYFRYGGVDYPYELHIGGVKRLNLRVRPDGSIRLSVPYATTQRQIDAFLDRYADRIAHAVARSQSKNRRVPESFLDDQSAKKEQLLAIIFECHRSLVIPRLSALAMTDEQRRFVISPTAVRIHAMKTRWGSCNFKKGTLNFNLYLLDQPHECIEYVVMHEFTHFLHANHSKAFYDALAEKMPDWKERKARLNDIPMVDILKK
jgi:predicted metal-dependent hydrolase